MSVQDNSETIKKRQHGQFTREACHMLHARVVHGSDGTARVVHGSDGTARVVHGSDGTTGRVGSRFASILAGRVSTLDILGFSLVFYFHKQDREVVLFKNKIVMSKLK